MAAAERRRAQQAQQKLELEVQSKLEYATLHAKRKKDLEYLGQAIQDALRIPGIPETFPAIVHATTELLGLQSESRLRLKYFLEGLEVDKIKANGKVSKAIAEIREARDVAQAKGGFGREVENADALIDELEAHGRKQATLISKLEFALKATRTIGRVTDSRKERLKTFVDAAKRGGVGLWCPAYVQALEIVDPEYLRSLGIPAKASP